jgi:hypothetical protein
VSSREKLTSSEPLPSQCHVLGLNPGLARLTHVQPGHGQRVGLDARISAPDGCSKDMAAHVMAGHQPSLPGSVARLRNGSGCRRWGHPFFRRHRSKQQFLSRSKDEWRESGGI